MFCLYFWLAHKHDDCETDFNEDGNGNNSQYKITNIIIISISAYTASTAIRSRSKMYLTITCVPQSCRR